MSWRSRCRTPSSSLSCSISSRPAFNALGMSSSSCIPSRSMRRALGVTLPPSKPRPRCGPRPPRTPPGASTGSARYPGALSTGAVASPAFRPRSMASSRAWASFSSNLFTRASANRSFVSASSRKKRAAAALSISYVPGLRGNSTFKFSSMPSQPHISIRSPSPVSISFATERIVLEYCFSWRRTSTGSAQTPGFVYPPFFNRSASVPSLATRAAAASSSSKAFKPRSMASSRRCNWVASAVSSRHPIPWSISSA